MNEVSPQEAWQRIQQGAFFVDVREPQEYEELHAQGAVLIPLSEFQGRYQEIPKNREVIVVCRSGGRSARAAQFLLDQGYNAFNLVGGTQDWVANGLPIGEKEGN